MGPTQQFVKTNKNNAILNQFPLHSIPEILPKGLKHYPRVLFLSRLPDSQAFLEQLAHFFERVLVKGQTEVFKFGQIVQDLEFVDDIFFELLPLLRRGKMRHFIEGGSKVFFYEAKDGSLGVVEEMPFLFVGLDS